MKSLLIWFVTGAMIIAALYSVALIAAAEVAYYVVAAAAA
jgi:hypothetical protein